MFNTLSGKNGMPRPGGPGLPPIPGLSLVGYWNKWLCTVGSRPPRTPKDPCRRALLAALGTWWQRRRAASR